MRTTLFIATLSLCLSATTASADVIIHQFNGPISGEAGDEYPTFSPDVTAIFSVAYDDATMMSGTMSLLLRYNDSSVPMLSIGQALSGFTWGFDSFAGTLTALSAKVGAGSSLVGENLGEWIAAGGTTGQFTDISGYWRFKDTVSGGVAPGGTPIGNYGVGAAGDIAGGVDSFGSGYIIDPGKTFPKSAFKSGNGDFMIIPDELILTDTTKPWPDGFKKQGPMAQDSVLVQFSFSGGKLAESDIKDGVFLFGTEGQPVVPEPGTWVTTLLACAAGAFLLGRRRAKIA
ncbi:MAG: hypothetical protein ACYTGZ_16665 [Planctomycetota bacterium]|jgi:hypothetical protein